MSSRKRSFFLLIFVLVVFAVGTFLFSDTNRMVYEETEEKEEAETSVSAPIAEIDFFADFRIRREQRRDEAKELYCSVLFDESRSEEKKTEAEESLEKLYRVALMEDRVEDILIGRNYTDAIFVIEDTMSLLILDQSILEEEEIAELISFVSAYTGIDPGSLSVFTIDS